jgi:hypothetical protein
LKFPLRSVELQPAAAAAAGAIEQRKTRRSSRRDGQVFMRFLLKALVFVVVIGAITLLAYALLFDLPSPQRDIVVPLEGR